jgi:hypothetical protein
MTDQPRTARYLSDLTPKMSTALIRCHTDVVLVGKHDTKGISTPTINALVRRELVAEGRDKRARRTWKPSTIGLVLISTEEPRFLAAQSQKGYTTNPALAMFGEPEAVDDATLGEFAVSNNGRHKAIKAGADQALFAEQRTLEDRLATLKRVAFERGIDTRSELRIVERGLDALERKIRAQRGMAA